MKLFNLIFISIFFLQYEVSANGNPFQSYNLHMIDYLFVDYANVVGPAFTSVVQNLTDLLNNGKSLSNYDFLINTYPSIIALYPPLYTKLASHTQYIVNHLEDLMIDNEGSPSIIFTNVDWKNLQNILQSVAYMAGNETLNFNINAAMSQDFINNPYTTIIGDIIEVPLTRAMALDSINLRDATSNLEIGNAFGQFTDADQVISYQNDPFAISFVKSLASCFSTLNSEFLKISSVWGQASMTFGQQSTSNTETQIFSISLFDFATIVSTLTSGLLGPYASVGATLDTFRSSILLLEN